MKSKLHTMLPYFIISAILTSLNALGSFLTARSSLPGYPVIGISKIFLIAILQFVAYFVIFYGFVYIFNNKMDMFQSKPDMPSDRTNVSKSTTDVSKSETALSSNESDASGFSMGQFKKHIQNSQYTCLYTLLILWIPALLAYYPAIYSYDAEVQLEQWIYDSFSIHHPLIHTLIMGLCYELGGMLIYSIFQMVILAFAINKGYQLLKKLDVANWITITYILFFGLFPFFPIMSVCMTKDVFFAAFYIWLIVLLTELIIFKEDFGKRKICEYFLVSILMMLFRNNGVYALIVLCIGLFFYKARPNKLLVTTILCVIAYYVISSVLAFSLDATGGEKKEMLSIPLQQIARTYVSHSAEMTQDDLEEIYYYLPQNGCAHYHPRLSDPVKMHFNEEHYKENPLGFWKCYFKNMKSHPDSYLIAPLYLTMGNWCPEDISHIYVYYDWWRDRINYVMTDVIPVFDDDYVNKKTPVPFLTAYYELFATKVIQYKIPLFRELFIPATYNVILALIVFLCIKKKFGGLFIVALPSIAYLGTCLLGPGVITRYSLPLMITVPFMLIILGYLLKKTDTEFAGN